MNHSPTAILLITLITITSLVDGNCPGAYRKGCGPPKGCIKSCTNPKLEQRCNKVDCETGCFCPKERAIEMVTDNFVRRCIPGFQKCQCTGGKEWMRCRNVPEPTCNNPNPRRKDCKGPPGCYCPRRKPIWHDGKCIPKSQCICPDSCVTRGCQQCKKCRCRSGQPHRCEETKSNCPNPSTEKGLKALEREGCYGQTLISRQCIFFSPCPKRYEPNPTRSCKSDLIQDRGCWTLLYGHCTFVAPCPEKSDRSCSDLTPGTMRCQMCKKCECMNGLKMCFGPEICPHPEHDGCIVERMSPGTTRLTCYWVSPCPNKKVKAPQTCSGHVVDKKNFCYLHNEEKGECEFISPCPETAVCKKGDTFCRECQECTCNKGEIQCTPQVCGDPVPHGCWVNGGKFGLEGCWFVSPCPMEEKQDKCRGILGESYCSECNQCICKKGDKAVCDKKKCKEVTAESGCYVSYKRSCIFVFPCP